MKFYIHELGCAKNTDDVNHMTSLLIDKGYLPLEGPAGADYIIVHTCGFIEEAVKESLDAILELADYKDLGCKSLIVSGCLSQRYQSSLERELPEVDLFLGTSYSHRIDDYINKKGAYYDRVDFKLKSYQHREVSKNYEYLKIAEGCDNYCSYCIIPKLRGPMRSKTIEELVQEATELSKRGAKELILIAQDLSRYGQDRGQIKILELLRALNQIPGINWIRLQYVYPDILDEEFFTTMAGLDKVVAYLDMPIQHASDGVLKRMNRHTSQADLRRVIELARKIMPHIVLRSTVMVGFPGETDEDFRVLMDFIEEIKFDKLGAFKYSDEEEVASHKLDGKVSEEVKEQRYEAIMALQMGISEDKLSTLQGQVLEVMVDEVYSDSWIGRTRGDSPDVDGIVYVEGNGVKVGDILKVKIKTSSEYDLVGEPYEFS
ncbi:MAG: 30S ribosomal protein S12 methylthiotransferase RimO [Tissierellia bacterium]|nr:30S ribosomal protein S12 methylthiotransferase RimO [Tissierellia bacterium]